MFYSLHPCAVAPSGGEFEVYVYKTYYCVCCCVCVIHTQACTLNLYRELRFRRRTQSADDESSVELADSLQHLTLSEFLKEYVTACSDLWLSPLTLKVDWYDTANFHPQNAPAGMEAHLTPLKWIKNNKYYSHIFEHRYEKVQLTIFPPKVSVLRDLVFCKVVFLPEVCMTCTECWECFHW